ncbi:hypothetical protein SAMN04488564_1173 [Lentzea waywayandensis]|uniref:Uncharacterized protein n=1 Tax=Lentzea waywayandensis TaxID=84724 RepID=A0A1I6FGL2_9PSEU|nr:hypothetical protein SAMN04488564_1173 [Lentzea waywayandensis]
MPPGRSPTRCEGHGTTDHSEASRYTDWLRPSSRMRSPQALTSTIELHRYCCPYWTISRRGLRCFQKPLRSRSRRKASNELPKLAININIKKAKFAFRLFPDRLIEQRFVPRQENPHLHTGVESIEFLQSPQAIGRLGVQHKPTCGLHRAVVGQHASENCRRVAKSSELVHSPVHVTAEPLYELRMLCRRTHILSIARLRRGVSTPTTPVRCDDSARAAVALRGSAAKPQDDRHNGTSDLPGEGVVR